MRGVVLRVAEELEPALCVALCCLVEGVVVDAGRGTGDLSVVCLRVEVDDLELCLEEIDGGDEGLALDAVLVEVVWVAVGSCDDDGAVGHERFDEAAEDHGVCDVGALKLVEAEDAAAFGDAGGDVGDCVDFVAVLHFHLVEVLVHALHEGVEVNSGLLLDVWRERIVEEIHKHGFAGTDVAVHVETLGQRLWYRR